MRRGRAGRFRPWVTAALVCAPLATAPSAVTGQEAIEISGVVIDVESGEGISGVALLVIGSDASAASDESGSFVIRGVPHGDHVLRVSHLAYGTHDHPISVAEGVVVRLEVRLAPEAVELAPLLVETESDLARERRTTGASFREITLEEIESAIGTSRHLGELIGRMVPGMHLRQSNQFPGVNVCLEFRSAASISLVNQRACSSPLVVVDGVRISDPTFLYGAIGLQDLHRIQVIPPGEAGTRYGTGSLYGVVLIETARPGLLVADADLEPRYLAPRPQLTFDWEQDPAGHSTGWSLAGAVLGNAIGLAAGLAIAQRCIHVVDDEIEGSCGSLGNTSAAGAAILLPAAGSVLGARLGGATDVSIGKPVPAAVGAGFMLLPGYAFALSTAGGEQTVVNAVGQSFLVLGVPVVVTLADRLFRRLR